MKEKIPLHIRYRGNFLANEVWLDLGMSHPKTKIAAGVKHAFGYDVTDEDELLCFRFFFSTKGRSQLKFGSKIIPFIFYYQIFDGSRQLIFEVYNNTGGSRVYALPVEENITIYKLMIKKLIYFLIDEA